MEKLILDYAFNGLNLSNPDGSLPTTAQNCSLITGPGTTALGNYSNALDFGTAGKAKVKLPVNKLNTSKFCVRVVFKIDGAVTSRQNLVESNALPFAFFLDAAPAPDDFKVVVSVAPKSHGWSGTTSEHAIDLKMGNWYLADLVYDTDTVAVFINGNIVSVHAFPHGLIEKWPNTDLFIGTWVDGARNHFNGKMAALQLYDGIPLALETQLDERRNHAEWFITYKWESIRPVINLGFPKNRIVYSGEAQAWIQLYDHGLIMYNESTGAAFEMHGSIFTYYTNFANKRDLGYLVSDEGNTTRPGGRKSIFRKGGIYWSASTGAIAVTGQIYLDYELMGESAWIGLPVAAAGFSASGREQVFQFARMYHRTGQPKALEVHGAILTKYLNTGGLNTWGYPTSNESDVKNNGVVIGKFSDFEGCTIYWSASSGAFEVHGDIREKYRSIKGPLSQLGFPTSDEGNIPGAAAPARYNTFQRGSILWFGSMGSIFVCEPFKIFLGRISTKESEGAFMGQNDLYLRVIIKDNGHEILRKRFPSSGDYGGNNSVEINQQMPITITPNAITRSIQFTVDVWESDSGAPFGGGDDHLGIYNKTLNMANAWGMRENNGVFNSGSFSKVNSITWSVQPQVNEALLTEVQKWWGVKNQKTPTLTYSQYAAAFRDVDSDTEWWDLTDWLEKAFYELVVKSLADNGNCFGMSLEGIYARKHRSLFSMPLDRFTNWNVVKNEFNIRHQYQVGASAIWWFVGEFLSGNTRDPKDVFWESFNCFVRGDNPVMCIAQNWDFSGAPHCILPVGWNASGNPWRITICDPNFPGQTRELLVDSNKNEYTYSGSSNYKGAEWSGGRLHYMPYCVLNERPRTPIWDAIVLILLGTIVILGSDTVSDTITDENGIDLDAFGADATNRLKQGKPLDNKFVSVKGYDAKSTNIRKPPVIIRLNKPKGVIPSELYMRSEKESSIFRINPGLLDNAIIRNVTLADLVQDRKYADLLRPIIANKQLFDSIRNREVRHLANDKKFLARIDTATSKLIWDLFAAGPLGKDIKHNIRGIRNGILQYAVKSKLNQFMIQSTIKLGEKNNVLTQDLGATSNTVQLTSPNSKTVKIEVENKLGVGKDRVKISIDKLPVALAKDLKINIKPGLAGLDILAAPDAVTAAVTIKTIINGKEKISRFDLPLEGGQRIRPSTILTNNELKAGKIDTIFGQLLDSKIIKAK